MPRLALSMIVRNEAGNLRRCLESVRGVVARNRGGGHRLDRRHPGHRAGLRRARRRDPLDERFRRPRATVPWPGLASDWVLSLDADEVLDPAARGGPPGAARLRGRGRLPGAHPQLRPEPGGPHLGPPRPAQRLPARPRRRAMPAFVDHENVRLFRRDPRVFFVGRVHESVGPAASSGPGCGLGRAPFLIHHFGLAADAETRARKNRLYRELGLQKVQDMPGNAQAHLELGLVELDNFGHLEEARACFERACRLNPRLGVAWFFAGVTHLRREEPREALRCLRQAEHCGHATPAVAEAARRRALQSGGVFRRREGLPAGLAASRANGTSIFGKQTGPGRGARGVARRGAAHGAPSLGARPRPGGIARPPGAAAGLAGARRRGGPGGGKQAAPGARHGGQRLPARGAPVGGAGELGAGHRHPARGAADASRRSPAGAGACRSWPSAKGPALINL